MNTNLRKFIIDLLDDDHGVNSKAYKTLFGICEENGWGDIPDAVEFQNGRAFISEKDAEILRNK